MSGKKANTQTVGAGPNRFRLRHDLPLGAYTLGDPEVILRCAHCPDWYEISSESRMKHDQARHMRKHRGRKRK